jgi:hypothetical protein
MVSRGCLLARLNDHTVIPSSLFLIIYLVVPKYKNIE